MPLLFVTTLSIIILMATLTGMSRLHSDKLVEFLNVMSDAIKFMLDIVTGVLSLAAQRPLDLQSEVDEVFDSVFMIFLVDFGEVGL